TPYLTGISLFRLARHSTSQPEIHSLANKMIAGLQSSQSVDGWRDLSLASSLQEATRLRTTLRASAALAVSRKAGLRVHKTLWDSALELATRIGNAAVLQDLDSPDFACLAITLGAFDLSGPLSPGLVAKAQSIRQALKPRWIATFRAHHDRL